jgi:hypothetical protein
MPQARVRSSAALLDENQSEVPNSWATTMTGTGRRIGTVHKTECRSSRRAAAGPAVTVQGDSL